MSAKTSRVAMLRTIKDFTIEEYPIPKIGDDEILVKVEACGVCGTDVHEYKSDPFGCLPIVLGHEGTGEIVQIGKNIKVDTVGKAVKLGDKIVTSIIPCGECEPCKTMPAKTELCENMGCYGLTPDDDMHLNGWFADYLVLKAGSTFFNVNEFDIKTRVMIEPIAVAVQSVERAKTTQLLNFATPVLVQGCGPIGLSMILVLKTMGIKNIFAIDGNDSRLEMAKSLGATDVFNFTTMKEEEITEGILANTNRRGVGFAFQTTGSSQGFTGIFKHIARGGGLCEVGHFVELGATSINPFADICFKEITIVGSYAYSPQIYPITIDCIKSALDMGLPVKEIVTDIYKLEDINEAFAKSMSMTGLKIAVGNC